MKIKTILLPSSLLFENQEENLIRTLNKLSIVKKVDIKELDNLRQELTIIINHDTTIDEIFKLGMLVEALIK